jgi:hypothetical protein
VNKSNSTTDDFATGDGPPPCRRHELPGSRERGGGEGEESTQHGVAAGFLQATQIEDTCG